MCVDGRVPRSAGQVLALSVRHVAMCARVAVVLRQTEIDHVDLMKGQLELDSSGYI